MSSGALLFLTSSKTCFLGLINMAVLCNFGISGTGDGGTEWEWLGGIKGGGARMGK